jgi:sialate O-acetylesterase
MRAGLTKRLRIRSRWYFALAGCVMCTVCWADPILPNLIGDHMVLQQGREIHVWGKADAGEKITVSLAETSSTVAADSAGRWSVLLAARTAGGPFTLKVGGKKTILIKDVLIGEVWVASGQSNMVFALSGSAGAAEELPKADYPDIRLFTVPKRVAESPQADTLPASWQACTPDSAKDFSAVAYYFARELHRKLNVPIGIIESAWPGTAIEEWIGPEAEQRDPQLKAILERWNASQGKSSVGELFDLEFDDFELLPSAAGKPLLFADFDDGSTGNVLGGSWSYDWRNAPETTFELVPPGRGGSGFAAHITGRISPADDATWTARFHLDGSPADLSAYAGIRFWVRGNGAFQFRSLQPTITDWDNYGKPLIPATADWTPVTIWFRDLRQDGWGVVADFTPSALTGFLIESMATAGYPSRPASGLYHGMIAPLLPFRFQGVIWYQGEGNGWRPHEYRKLLPAMIENWRAASQREMQFLIVQLPNHGATPDQPSESAWAEVREAQFLAEKNVPDTGLAVTIDVGDPKDLHPHRKAEVGQRLALWALGSTYKKNIVYSGPLYESMVVDGGAIRIKFTHVGGGLEAKGGGALRGFAIAGADQKFRWASAVIRGDEIVVSSPDVAAPAAVRYAWGGSPECNFFNAEGLPASPFRTDEWPGTLTQSQ